MKFFTGDSDFATGEIGLCELAVSALNDRSYKRWSLSEIKAYINLEQTHLGEVINLENETFFLISATTPTVAGQTLYAMPDDLARFCGLDIVDAVDDREPKKLREVPLDDRDFYERLRQANEKADYGFFFVRGTSFRMMPESADGAKTLRVHYVGQLTQLVNDVDVSQIPVAHHELLALGGARRALAKYDKVNETISGLYNEGMEILVRSIQRYSQTQERITEPWWGSFGPIEFRQDGRPL